jgi:hypothetical protein
MLSGDNRVPMLVVRGSGSMVGRFPNGTLAAPISSR